MFSWYFAIWMERMGHCLVLQIWKLVLGTLEVHSHAVAAKCTISVPQILAKK